MEEALSGRMLLQFAEFDSKDASLSSVIAPLQELREMYEHASLPVGFESLSTCQVRCKRWAKYITEMSAKVTGLIMSRQNMHDAGTGKNQVCTMWLVDENLKGFPYLLNASFAVERGVSALRILCRYCEGRGWDCAAQVFSSCAIDLEYALWSLWPFLHNRSFSHVQPSFHGPSNPSPPHPSTLLLVGPEKYCRFSSLSMAIDAARPCDTLLLLEDVIEAGAVIAIDKELSIVGCSPCGSVNVKARFYITAAVSFSRVCLQGVSFVDCEPTITCSGPKANVLIRHSLLTSAGRKEIMFLNNHASCVMKECLVYNAGDVALMVEDGSRLSMVACDVMNVGVGITVAGKSTCSIRLCRFKDCRENAVIVMDPLAVSESGAARRVSEGTPASASPAATSLVVDHTTFINRCVFVTVSLQPLVAFHPVLRSGFIAPHKHACNPSDTCMLIDFSTVLIQVRSAAAALQYLGIACPASDTSSSVVVFALIREMQKYNALRQQTHAKADKVVCALVLCRLTLQCHQCVCRSALHHRTQSGWLRLL
jgi:hypothetical protein